ncbi:hypothetical protein [Streptosporangium sp. 'caverna']|uniref:hypothetical protein n=1 Tax=Streptosporangium sp. 'caverna' TaxID=2202249 RepID=UPI000D7E79FF|nr:hypothetical protein [Streptosporangium sp. 'caverna']AWS46761.1 hypothetical protein DKM19_41155 [Streptosporangium sp. 'caverna']
MPDGAADRIIAIGEAEGTAAPTAVAQLQRLEHLRGPLPSARAGAPPKLLLLARSGFTDDLVHTAAGRADVELIDIGRLYGGA